MAAQDQICRIERAGAALLLAGGVLLCAVAAAAPSSEGATPDPANPPPLPSESNVSVAAPGGTAPQDAALAERVRAKLAGDALLHHSDITVAVNSAVVTLTGNASSADARSEATVATEAVDGVKSVINQLAVSPTAAAVGAQVDRAAAQTQAVGSDLWLSAKVKAALLADSPAYGSALSVDCHAGVVALSGTLDNPRKAIPHLREVIGRIDGVRRIDTSALEGGAQ